LEIVKLEIIKLEGTPTMQCVMVGVFHFIECRFNYLRSTISRSIDAMF
jgi:hypothetical protein